MEIKEILSMVDHTLLKQDATWQQIKKTCDEAIRFETASVCIPPSFVEATSDYCNQRIKICTVIGFPNGYSTEKVKLFEIKNAIENGADEIDTVINIGDLKDRKFKKILDDLKAERYTCRNKILKVIIETCLLTDDEKKRMCEIVSEAGADFIKTSTGFSHGGATREDIALFSRHIAPNVKIKAAGGISSFDDARDFIELGASRLGTSRLIKILLEENGGGY
ncbi:MAG: deoxyribose-phosphate aldolase [Clostridia bacterium]|nr:deoxyribose-phosphate aldolase [Clostridia bacterium]MBR2296661.1 deoxyribose-phosphate aldolase [Clostridia bacterium]